MAIIPLKGLLSDLARSHSSKCALQRDHAVGLICANRLLGLANASGSSLRPCSSCSFSEMSHGVAQKRICFGLITRTVCFEPRDDVGIQTHSYGLLLWPIEHADFGSAPVKNCGSVGKINVFVFFCGDRADVSLLLLCELPHRPSFHATQQREPK